MKKSELKLLIKEIVQRKLNEAYQQGSKFGYIMKDKDSKSDDPRIQMIGYGNMPLSYWKKKVVKDAEQLVEKLKYDDWRAARHIIQTNGVLYSMINMLYDILEDEKLKEQTLGAVQNPLQSDKPQSEKSTADATGDMSDSDRAKMANLKKQQDKYNNDIRQVDAEIQKLKEPVLKKTQDLDRKKSSMQQKVGRITSGIESIEKKYGK
jgi:flagellar motility protein MotE (MotC chaperone)